MSSEETDKKPRFSIVVNNDLPIFPDWDEVKAMMGRFKQTRDDLLKHDKTFQLGEADTRALFQAVHQQLLRGKTDFKGFSVKDANLVLDAMSLGGIETNKYLLSALVNDFSPHDPQRFYSPPDIYKSQFAACFRAVSTAIIQEIDRLDRK